jgi:hypothetical protein
VSNDDKGGLIFAAVLFLSIAAWVTHIIVCLKDGEWGFLIAGALFFPVAIIHGVGCWFGAW